MNYESTELLQKGFVNKFWQFYGINQDIWMLTALKFPKGEELA
jgi:hypothetical protein